MGDLVHISLLITIVWYSNYKLLLIVIIELLNKSKKKANEVKLGKVQKKMFKKCFAFLKNA